MFLFFFAMRGRKVLLPHIVFNYCSTLTTTAETVRFWAALEPATESFLVTRSLGFCALTDLTSHWRSYSVRLVDLLWRTSN